MASTHGVGLALALRHRWTAGRVCPGGRAGPLRPAGLPAAISAYGGGSSMRPFPNHSEVTRLALLVESKNRVLVTEKRWTRSCLSSLPGPGVSYLPLAGAGPSSSSFKNIERVPSIVPAATARERRRRPGGDDNP